MTKLLRIVSVLSALMIFAVITTSAQMDGGELIPGETVTVKIEDEPSAEFVFEGEEEMVISITVEADDDTDTVLTILDDDGDEVARDDDSGTGSNPMITRLALPNDGEYTVVLESYGDSDMDDEFEITLLETEILDLGEGDVNLTMGDDIQSDVMMLEVEDNQRYLVRVVASDTLESTLYIKMQNEEEYYANTRLYFTGVNSFAFIYEADEDGWVTISIDYEDYNGDDLDFEISASPVE